MAEEQKKNPILKSVSRGPLVTKTGKVLTDADIEALADEAEAGYDVSDLRDRDKSDAGSSSAADSPGATPASQPEVTAGLTAPGGNETPVDWQAVTENVTAHARAVENAVGTGQLLIGCPVAGRGWIIRPWALFAEQACEQAGIVPSYVVAASAGDDTVEPILKFCADRGRDLAVLELKDDDTFDQRTWNAARYAQMARIRNHLLGRVRELAPTWFLSVDSDILLHEQTIVHLLATAAETGADVVGGKCYLTEEGRSAPSYCNLLNEKGMMRPDIDYVQQVDAVMAVKLMDRRAYSVDYQPHFQGEDVGIGLAWRREGLKVVYDGAGPVNKHVMRRDQLDCTDARCGY